MTINSRDLLRFEHALHQLLILYHPGLRFDGKSPRERRLPIALQHRVTEEFDVFHAHTIHLIREIEHAIHRIAAGTYGCCGDCGASISRLRLRATPYARHCVRCDEIHSDNHRVSA